MKDLLNKLQSAFIPLENILVQADDGKAQHQNEKIPLEE